MRLGVGAERLVLLAQSAKLVQPERSRAPFVRGMVVLGDVCAMASRSTSR